MRASDRHAPLAGSLLFSILVGFSTDWLSWDEVSRLAWSIAALLAAGMLILLLQTLFLGVYWTVWKWLPRKKMRRRGRVLDDHDAETVQINVRKLVEEYQEIPRFNFK